MKKTYGEQIVKQNKSIIDKQSNDILEIHRKTREDVISDFRKEPDIWRIFSSFNADYQEELILFCMGEKGLKLTYDTIFRLIMDSRKHPERMESFLSAILDKKINIVEIFEREGIHLTEKASFVIMDILVRANDGEYINVEMQKIGYAFPLARTDCYSADLIMRQYNDAKQKHGDDFSFSKLSKVITIVIMEKSFGDFIDDTAHSIHHRVNVFDTGINADGLSESYYICLDTYRKYIHTEIKNKRDAWLLFLGSADINDILEVCEAFPEFISLYEDMFKLQIDERRLMTMFSEALEIMNKNTERYMVEFYSKECEEAKNMRDEAISELNEAKSELDETKSELDNEKSKHMETQNKLSDAQNELRKRDIEMAELRKKLAMLES